MREIKFRFWSNHLGKFVVPNDGIFVGALKDPDMNPMQYTGLKDRNGDKEVYECDIIDTEGNIIGNQYETPALLERKTNLPIQGFGTKAWLSTYKEAVERGCHDA